VTAAGVFRGDGQALNADVDDDDAKKAGAGFRKRATRCVAAAPLYYSPTLSVKPGSKRAREERVLAAERRLRGLQGEEKGEAS